MLRAGSRHPCHPGALQGADGISSGLRWFTMTRRSCRGSSPISRSFARVQEDGMRSQSATISRFGLVLLIVGLLLPGVAAAQSTPVATSGEPVALRLGVSSWVGYGPLWLAEERGFF